MQKSLAISVSFRSSSSAYFLDVCCQCSYLTPHLSSVCRLSPVISHPMATYNQYGGNCHIYISSPEFSPELQI